MSKLHPHTPLPEQVLVGRRTLMMALGINSATVLSELQDKGIVVQVDHGAYDLIPSCANYCRHLRKQAAGHIGRKGGDVVTAAASLKDAQRKLTDLRIAQIEGKVVDREALVDTWSAIARQDRALFISFPARARFDMPHLTGQDQEKLMKIATEMLAELAASGEVGPGPPSS